MSKIIAVTSGKGGTGKSSICSELGFALAKQGHRTLIIELDFGLRCLDIMLGVKNDIKYDLGNVLKGECDIYQATTQVKIATNLSIVCAPEDPFARVDAETIKNICQEMRKYYEYIIVDTSAGTNASVFDVVEQSDLILINTTPDPVCVRDARTMSDEFYKRGNKKQRLIINKVNPDLFKADLVVDLDEIIDTVGVQLIGVIPDMMLLLSQPPRENLFPPAHWHSRHLTLFQRESRVRTFLSASRFFFSNDGFCYLTGKGMIENEYCTYCA